MLESKTNREIEIRKRFQARPRLRLKKQSQNTARNETFLLGILKHQIWTNVWHCGYFNVINRVLGTDAIEPRTRPDIEQLNSVCLKNILTKF